jgi:uncharacterized protein (DUF1684 family)
MAVAYLELIDWRRRVADLFVDLRKRPADADTLAWFRGQKDRLFREHPQSPLPASERPAFAGLPYWPFDPEARVNARFVPVSVRPEDDDRLAASSPQAAAREVDFDLIGHLSFELRGQPLTLAAFWIAGYAGGLFVPFNDSTSGHETYGGGRYLLDTIKSADFGSDMAADQVVLDFNYAYHPSCAYDPRWVCPLAPPDSRLAIPIRAGEQSR